MDVSPPMPAAAAGSAQPGDGHSPGQQQPQQQQQVDAPPVHTQDDITQLIEQQEAKAEAVAQQLVLLEADQQALSQDVGVAAMALQELEELDVEQLVQQELQKQLHEQQLQQQRMREEREQQRKQQREQQRQQAEREAEQQRQAEHDQQQQRQAEQEQQRQEEEEGEDARQTGKRMRDALAAGMGRRGRGKGRGRNRAADARDNAVIARLRRGGVFAYHRAVPAKDLARSEKLIAANRAQVAERRAEIADLLLPEDAADAAAADEGMPPPVEEPEMHPATVYPELQEDPVIRARMVAYLRERRALQQAKEDALVSHYKDGVGHFTEYMQKLRPRAAAAAAAPVHLSSLTRTSSRSFQGAAVVRSDYEQAQLMLVWKHEEDLKRMTTCPAMQLDPWKSRWSRFPSTNGYISDPELERQVGWPVCMEFNGRPGVEICLIDSLPFELCFDCLVA